MMSRPVTRCRSVSTLEILIAADSSSFSARCFSRVRSSGQVPAVPATQLRDPELWRGHGACFVAAPEFRIIRLHTRYRRDLTEERTREKQRAEKLLESAAIKISSVLTDLHGVTGRDIMDQLIAGERNPKVLAQLARTAARRKISQLEEALEGAEFFTPAHAALLAKVLARIDRLSADIEDLSQVIEQLLAPYEEQLAQAKSMPGWARRAAQDAVAETGVDMTRFRTGPHLVSWGGRAPQDHQSGKRTGRAKAKKGNRYLGAVLGETAVAAGRTQTREGARHRRLARRRGAAKACVATGNTQLKVYQQSCGPPAACATRISARTTTNASATSAARLPTTSASWNPSASRSPSAASPNPTPTGNRLGPGRLTHTAPADPIGPYGQGPLPHAQLISLFRVSRLGLILSLRARCLCYSLG